MLISDSIIKVYAVPVADSKQVLKPGLDFAKPHLDNHRQAHYKSGLSNNLLTYLDAGLKLKELLVDIEDRGECLT